MKYINIFLIFLFIVLSGCAAMIPSHRPYTKVPIQADFVKNQISVYANGGWQDTTIELNKGDKIFIDAQGKWSGGLGWDGGPRGSVGLDLGQRIYREEPAATALIGRIGNGSPFSIGDQYLGTVTQLGNLSMRMNDVTTSDNSGTLQVDVYVQYANVAGKQEQSISMLDSQYSDADISLVPNFYSEPRTSDVAIVIGIESYQNITHKSDYSYNDATLVNKYLKALGFQERNIVYLTNERASLSGIKKSFEAWLPNHVKKNSKVFVYYSGHGAPDTKGNGYIVPYDGDPNYLDVTGYPLDQLYTNLSKLEAEEIIVVMDSCFSGAGGKSVMPKGARPISIEVKNPVLLSNKVVILSSSRMNQISTSYPDKELGLLTYHFLKALKDGKMTLFDIYNYIEPMVEDEARKLNIEQTPQLMPVQKISGKAFSLR